MEIKNLNLEGIHVYGKIEELHYNKRKYWLHPSTTDFAVHIFPKEFELKYKKVKK